MNPIFDRSILEEANTIKAWAMSEMDSAEAAATRDFQALDTDDGYLSFTSAEVVDSDIFVDYRAARSRFQFWQDLSEFIANASSSTAPKEHTADLGYRAAQEAITAADDLNFFEEELEEHGPEDRSDFDDEWFRISNEIDNRRLQLKVLAVVLATLRLAA
jgi:hypothetical protein